MTFVQLVRPGAPVVLGSFASSISMQSGAPDVRHAGAVAGALRDGLAGAAPRRPVPLRRQPVRLEGRRRAGGLRVAPPRSTPTILGGVNFVLHAAGWLEGGLTVGYEKFILDADQCGMAAVFVKGIDLTENGQAIDAIRTNGPGQHFLGHAAHARQLRERLLPLGDRRQQQLRAVARGRLARRGAARQRRSGSGCSPSTRRRRSTTRSTRRSSSS